MVWLITVAFSIVFILGASAFVCRNLDIMHVDGAYAERAVVESVGKITTESYDTGEATFEDSRMYFYAKIKTGEFKGEKVKAAQTFDNYTAGNHERPVQPGDKIVVYNYGTSEGDADWVFGGFYRLGKIIAFGLLFGAGLLFFGHLKGLNTLISLVFTCMMVFMVFVPSILAGYNVYVMVCITCVYTIVMTLLVTSGATEKALTTILGCSFGVLVAAILEVFFDKILMLTGMLDEHSIYLGYLDSGVEINLRSLIFGMIVIGAMGAVMDVAMDISSSLHEVHYRAPELGFGELFKSGLTIGRDVMGTMANTLVLAYIGSNLCSILLLITYSSSLMELLNRENIVVEILQALIGSSAILLTMPLTSAICALLYTNKRVRALENVKPSDDYDPDAPVTILQPGAKIIGQTASEEIVKEEFPKPAKKRDASRFTGFFYEGFDKKEDK